MIIHSIQQLVLLLRVYSISFKTIDVPFKNGHYDKGENSFESLSKSTIHYDKSNTIIGEIILSDSFDDNQKYALYLQIIEYFENYIKVYNPVAELLTFEVPKKDLPYFNAVSDKGYKLMKETQQDINISQTYLFDKQIREKNN